MKQSKIERVISILVVVLILLSAIPTTFAHDDAILITTQQELEALDGATGNYILANDITLTGEWKGIEKFAGNFDGGNHVIRGLVINYPTRFYIVGNAGLFTTIPTGSTVKNIIVENPNVLAGYNVGVIAGRNSGVISNCHVVGGSVSGGMYSDTGYEFWEESGFGIGGLVGYNRETGHIMKSSSGADVNGWHEVGGFVGRNEGKINNSYSCGNVNNTDEEDQQSRMLLAAYGGYKYSKDGAAPLVYGRAGGLVGYNTAGAVIENCYSDSPRNGSAASVVAGFNSIGGLVGNNSGAVLTSYSANKTFVFPADGAKFNIETIDPSLKYTLTYRWKDASVHPSIGTAKGSCVNTYYSNLTSGAMPALSDENRGIDSNFSQLKRSRSASNSTFDGWDFDEIWALDPALGTPILDWQHSVVTFDKNVNDSAETFTEMDVVFPAVTVDNLPEEPAANNTFNSWNTEADGSGEIFDITTPVLDNMTVYAVWSDTSFVNYDKATDDDVNNMPENVESFAQGEEFTVSGLIPERAGYNFMGWQSDIDELVYNSQSEGSASVMAFTMPETGVTLTAIWEAVQQNASTYSVSYNKNTEDDVTNMPENIEAVEAGSSFEVSNLLPVREGYTFMGWSSSIEGESTVYNDQTATVENAVMSFVMPQNDVTLSAIWLEYAPGLDGYPVTYDKNTSDAVTNMPENVPIVRNWVEFEVSSLVPVREGYTFMGWQSDIEGDTKIYYDKTADAKQYTSFTMPQQVVVLSALWRSDKADDDKYSVTYNKNTEDEVTNMPENVAEVAAEESYAVSSLVPLRKGYVFKGWKSSFDTNIYYSKVSGAKLVKSFIMPEKDVVLTAVWTKEGVVINTTDATDTTMRPVSSSGPKTGDYNSIALYGTVTAVCLLGIITIMVAGKDRSSEKK